MKKAAAFMMTVLLTAAMGNCICMAAEIDSPGSHEVDLSIQAKSVYTQAEDQYTAPLKDGSAVIVLPDNTEITAEGGASLDGLNLVVIEITKDDQSAYKDISEAVKGKVNAFKSYNIFFTDSYGNKADPKSSIIITVKLPQGYKQPVVYSVGRDGTLVKITSAVKDGIISFGISSSGSFVIGDAAVSGGTGNSGGTGSSSGNGASNPAKTGDERPIGLYALGVIAAAAVIAGIFTAKKKRRSAE